MRAGQCYNVQIALSSLVNEAAKEGSKGRNWAIFIADTVSVAGAGAAPEVLTKGVSKALKDVSYQINDDEEGEEEEAAKSKKKKAKAATVAEGGVVMDAKTRTEMGRERVQARHLHPSPSPTPPTEIPAPHIVSPLSTTETTTPKHLNHHP